MRSRADQEFLDKLDRLRYDVDAFFDELTDTLMYHRDTQGAMKPEMYARFDELIATSVPAWRQSTAGVLGKLHDSIIPSLPPRYFD